MDRIIVYPSAIPLDTDILSIQRNAMVAVGYLAQATLGTSVVVDGLACLATAPASMSVVVGPGCITQYGSLDTTPFGSLPAEPAEALMLVGVNLGTNSFGLTAPSSPGESIDYLVEASFLQADGSPVVLPYYNAANPSQPYSGPSNSGTAQNTQRLQSVQLQVKPGAPGLTGTQTLPAVDAGWVGLYCVTVAYGQTAITNSNISPLPTAPFLPWKLPQLTPGTRNLAAFTPATQGYWLVPAGISAVRVKMWAGGGAGGAGFGGAGGGGAGGGYGDGYYPVAAGQSIFVTVGEGGVGSGTAGGSSSFGSFASTTGGAAGLNGSLGTGGAGGAPAGGGFATTLVIEGNSGGNAFEGASLWMSGQGGGSFGSPGATSVLGALSASIDGMAGVAPGAGGSGGIGSGLGGQGGAGLVLVEW